MKRVSNTEKVAAPLRSKITELEHQLEACRCALYMCKAVLENNFSDHTPEQAIHHIEKLLDRLK